MAIPDYQMLMLPLLKRAAKHEIRVPDIRDDIANEFGLTPDEREQLLESGTQRIIDNRLHWAKIYLSKAGLIDTPSRGKFIATDEGRALLATKPSSINNELLSRYPSFVAFKIGRATASVDARSGNGRAEKVIQVEAATPEEQIDAAVGALNATLASDLIERILHNAPAFFERLIIDLLVKMGYGGSRSDAATSLGKPNDGGVDGVINEDLLGLDRVYIQAKRYAEGNNIGRPEVQAFLGSLVGNGAAKGVFVTTSEFSAQAKEFVKHLPQRIVLIDGKRLAELMIEHKVGIRVERSIEVKRIDEDFFLDE
ncbi:MAG: restriction endonuclease [Rhizobiales bacterium]|nr:restriction endonuclease [Hyphomicrobiales bacterium]